MNESKPETEDVWTYDLSELTGAPRPIKTTCLKGMFGHPHKDGRGETMYTNTHFRTEAEAWNALVLNAEAAVRMDSAEYRDLQIRLTRATGKLAESAAFANDVQDALAAWKRRQAASERPG